MPTSYTCNTETLQQLPPRTEITLQDVEAEADDRGLHEQHIVP